MTRARAQVNTDEEAWDTFMDTHAGVEITALHSDYRYDARCRRWYPHWDVPSGVCWDAECITGVYHLAEYAGNEEYVVSDELEALPLTNAQLSQGSEDDDPFGLNEFLSPA